MRTPRYDLEALKNNIERLDGEIQMFRDVAERSEREDRWEQAELFHKAVEKAEAEKRELEGYVRQIEYGSPVRPD